MRLFQIATSVLLITALVGCSNETNTEKGANQKTALPQQFNISFLLDLSDRIDTTKYPMHPEQYGRDIELILSVVNVLKAHMGSKGTYQSLDKIRVLFHPTPQSTDIANYAQRLNKDLEGLNPKEKKVIYDNLISDYRNSLESIYELAINKEVFEGSDIWRFMKDDVQKKCIVDDGNYRNILIILTDGYMFWPYNKISQDNRFNYITRSYSHFNQFRNISLLNSKFEKGDYGFIPVQKDLSNLEIIVAGVNPPKTYPQDFDIIKKYWSKWFDEMGVKSYEILKTDLPIYTKKAVQDFINSPSMEDHYPEASE